MDFAACCQPQRRREEVEKAVTHSPAQIEYAIEYPLLDRAVSVPGSIRSLPDTERDGSMVAGVPWPGDSGIFDAMDRVVVEVE